MGTQVLSPTLSTEPHAHGSARAVRVHAAWVVLAVVTAATGCPSDTSEPPTLQDSSGTASDPTAPSSTSSPVTATGTGTGTTSPELTSATTSPGPTTTGVDDTDGSGDTSEPTECGQRVIDDAALQSSIAALSGERSVIIDGRMSNLGERASAASRLLAREWISEQMEELGLEVSLHDYGSGANVVGELPGRSGEFLIVSAHYDTVEGTPGANDDATGVAALFEIARAMQGCPLEHGIRFVAFDEEETGLQGSNAYAAQLIADGDFESTLGVVQLDTIGSDSNGDGVFGLADCGLASNEALAETILDNAATLAPRLQPLQGCLEIFASDHLPFQNDGLPAVLISEPAFFSHPRLFDLTQCYHMGCDNLGNIDLLYASDVTLVVLGAVRDIVAG